MIEPKRESVKQKKQASKNNLYISFQDLYKPIIYYYNYLYNIEKKLYFRRA
jgi:hypothetical protein